MCVVCLCRVCVCLSVSCVSVCVVCVCARMHVRHVCMDMCARAYTHTQICKHACTQTCIHVHTCCVCACECMFVRMVCTCVWCQVELPVNHVLSSVLADGRSTSQGDPELGGLEEGNHSQGAGGGESCLCNKFLKRQVVLTEFNVLPMLQSAMMGY